MKVCLATYTPFSFSCCSLFFGRFRAKSEYCSFCLHLFTVLTLTSYLFTLQKSVFNLILLTKMFRYCCVPKCDSHRKDVKLTKMPNNREKVMLWASVIMEAVPSAIQVFDEMTWAEIYKLHICHKHFERKYVNYESFRLTSYACPTLFSDQEIQSGTPTKSYFKKVIESTDHGKSNYIDHTYSQKLRLHEDHTYSRDPGDPSLTDIAITVNLSGDISFKREIQKIDSVKKTRQDSNLQQSADAAPSGKDAEDIAETEETTEEPSVFDDDFAPTSPSPPSPVPRIEAESAGSGKLFSWQKSELIPADDVEEPLTLAELEEQTGISLYCDDTPEPQTVPQVPETSIKEVEYRCKDCGEIIDGFQFWCVQCFGCALCGACEARGEHKLHYVLRAPPHRPYKQTQVVLATIRHQLQNENLLTQLGPDDEGVKLEVKEEPSEEDCSVVNVNTVPREPDPLDAADPLRHDPAPDEPHHTATEETPHPPFKRPRLADYIEKDFTNRGTPLQVKVTSRPKPHEQILINLDNVDDQVEFVTEELETDDRDDENTDIATEELESDDNRDDENTENATEELEDEVSDEYTEIETLDDDYSIEDDDSIDSRIDEDEDATIVNETVEVLEDDVDSRIDEDTDVVTRINEIDGVKVVEALAVRRVRRETGMLQARGSPESMVRSLPSEAVVELRPLSSVEIRKWTADSTKRRK